VTRPGLWSVLLLDNADLDAVHKPMVDGFETETDAIRHARAVVRGSLVALHDAGMSPDALLAAWSRRGRGAVVVGPGEGWSGARHARGLAEAICA
jgi:hypothetical protein